MIDFHRITDNNDAHYSDFTNLYEHAFPTFERRNLNQLATEIFSNSGFFANVLIDEGDFLGIFNFWKFCNFNFIEHFAITEISRNKEKGKTVISDFLDQCSLPIVLEVEMPGPIDTLRRIKFYESLGFKVLPHYYAQPAYSKDGFLIPMLLMSNDYHYAQLHFEKIKECIYKNVYNYKEPNYR